MMKRYGWWCFVGGGVLMYYESMRFVIGHEGNSAMVIFGLAR